MNKPISQMGRDELIRHIDALTAANKLQAESMVFLVKQVYELEDQLEELEELRRAAFWGEHPKL